MFSRKRGLADGADTRFREYEDLMLRLGFRDPPGTKDPDASDAAGNALYCADCFVCDRVKYRMRVLPRDLRYYNEVIVQAGTVYCPNCIDGTPADDEHLLERARYADRMEAESERRRLAENPHW